MTESKLGNPKLSDEVVVRIRGAPARAVRKLAEDGHISLSAAATVLLLRAIKEGGVRRWM